MSFALQGCIQHLKQYHNIESFEIAFFNEIKIIICIFDNKKTVILPINHDLYVDSSILSDFSLKYQDFVTLVSFTAPDSSCLFYTLSDFDLKESLFSGQFSSDDD